MDDKVFFDYLTTTLNLDDSLENENSSINVDQVIERNLIAIRGILNETPTTGSEVLNYIERHIENLIKSEEEEVEILDCDSFLMRLGRDLDLYSEKPSQHDDTLTEITKIAQEMQTNIFNQSWDDQFNISVDENGNPFTKHSNIYEWLKKSNWTPPESTTSTGKKSVRFDLDLNQIRDISPRLSVSSRTLRSGRQLFIEENYNQHDITQLAAPLDPPINIKGLNEPQETIDVKFSIVSPDSISLTRSFNDTTEYVDVGCSPITIIKPIVMQSIGTMTENFLPCTKSIGTSPIRNFVQLHEPNYDRLIDQKFRYLFPIINRTIFSKTKKYFKYFVKKNKLLKVTGAKKFRSLGINTSPGMKKSRKVQTEKKGKPRRNDCLNKNDQSNGNSKSPMKSKAKKVLDSRKVVKSTQQTLSQMFRQTVKEVLLEKAVTPTDVSLSLIRDYRDPNDEVVRLSGFSIATGSQIKNETIDYKSCSPLKIADSVRQLENLNITDGAKPRRKLYTKSDINETSNQYPSPTKSINSEQLDISEYRRVPLEPKIIVLSPLKQINHNIEIINTIPKNKLQKMFKRQGLCDQLSRVLVTPIEYTKDVSYLINHTTGVYEPMHLTPDESLEVSLNQQRNNKQEFVTSSQMNNFNEPAYFSNSFSPISRILS